MLYKWTHTGRVKRAAALVLAELALFCAPWVYALEPDQIFDKVSPSIVLVLAMDKKTSIQGSGVVIAPQHVITNCHVVAKREHVSIKWGELQFSASLKYADPNHDLCQLYVPDLKAPAVAMRRLATIRVGQRAYAIGNPEGLELTLTEGLVSAIRTLDGRQWIQTSALYTHGSSGGGLFDTDGRLIGLTSLGLKQGPGLNFAIPADYVSEVSARAEAATPAKSAVTPMSVADAAAVAKNKADGFPRTLNGTEIVAHFARHRQIEANPRGYRPFTLKIHSGNFVDRNCFLCRTKFGTGQVSVKWEEGLVCFKWYKVSYPDSGCFMLVETSPNSFLIRPADQDVAIMEYSIAEH